MQIDLIRGQKRPGTFALEDAENESTHSHSRFPANRIGRKHLKKIETIFDVRLTGGENSLDFRRRFRNRPVRLTAC